MSKKEHKQKEKKPEPELLEATKELEQDTKMNNEMLKLEEEILNETGESEEVLVLKNTIETLENKVKQSQAELINYRKRKDEETVNAMKYANQDIIKDLLIVVDNLERTLKSK